MAQANPASLAVLISGGGRTLLNLQRKIEAGQLPARIARVVSSCPDAAGVERARSAGLPVTIADRRKLRATAFQQTISNAVEGVDWVVMAGFLSLWEIPAAFEGRVVNIHPALLPDFAGRGMYGDRVHRAVLDAGRKESGCTVHLCDNEYDHGPIILQRRVPVLAVDTVESLAARVFEAECEAYPEALSCLIAGTVPFRR